MLGLNFRFFFYIYPMINIRQAKYKELETIVDFQMRMARETEGLELDKATLQKGVENVFTDFSRGIYYVATADGDEVVACLLTTPEWSDWRNGTIIWIQSVYVREDFRNKGIFRSMYKFIKQLVEEDNDLKGIRLYVEKTNLNAQKVYEAMGMGSDHYHFFEWMKAF